jgi:hypothetical protein
VTLGRLVALVGQNVSRSKKNFLMSAIGIIVGVSTFVFFIGLSEGIKDVVLGRIFLVDQVEVVAKKLDTGFMQLGGGRVLDDGAAQDLAKLPGVQSVSPKMKFTFPTRGYGGENLFGKTIWAEIIADGIEPSLVEKELKNPSEFQDFDAEFSCAAGEKCPDGQTCESGKCVRQACTYVEATYLTDCPGVSYCAEDTGKCEMPVPALASNHLLELYNGSLATAMSSAKNRMPKLSKNTVVGFELNLTLGKSFLGRSDRSKPLTRRVRLVGFSDQAISVGITLPLPYVKRYNEKFGGAEAASTYHSIILRVSDQTEVPAIVAQVRKAGFELAESTENAERAGDIASTSPTLTSPAQTSPTTTAASPTSPAPTSPAQTSPSPASAAPTSPRPTSPAPPHSSPTSSTPPSAPPHAPTAAPPTHSPPADSNKLSFKTIAYAPRKKPRSSLTTQAAPLPCPGSAAATRSPTHDHQKGGLCEPPPQNHQASGAAPPAAQRALARCARA